MEYMIVIDHSYTNIIHNHAISTPIEIYYSDRLLELSADKIHKKDTLTVSFDVTNTGSREGAEVAQLYIRDVESSEPRPLKELKGFSKVLVKPGETRNVAIQIDPNALSFFSSKKNKWIVEPGQFEILVGSSSKDVRLKKTFMLE